MALENTKSEWERRLSDINDSTTIEYNLSVVQSSEWDKWEYYMKRKNTFYFRNNFGQTISVTLTDKSTLNELSKMKYHSKVNLEYSTR
jgi:hypothetical protein